MKFSASSRVLIPCTFVEYIICIKKNQKKAVEKTNKIRTKTHYIEQIAKIQQLRDEGKKITTRSAFGLQAYSVLNDLNFYHTVENRSQDVMHDVYEGAMPFVVKHFFKYLINHKIITETGIETKIKSFNYGTLERRNIPSPFLLHKKNLNQNASQMHCLMKNFPIIFAFLRKEVDPTKLSVIIEIWPVIEYLLKINQKISSSIIKESDLINLKGLTKQFLKMLTDKFKVDLISKLHHFTTLLILYV